MGYSSGFIDEDIENLVFIFSKSLIKIKDYIIININYLIDLRHIPQT